MDIKLQQLLEEIDKLDQAIEKSPLPEGRIETLNPMAPSITKTDLSYLVKNLYSRIESYGSKEITSGLDSTIDGHIENVKSLIETAIPNLTNNANTVTPYTSKIILTVYIIFNEIESELFSFENLEEKNLIPKNLKNRLRSLDSEIQEISSKTENIDKIVSEIQSAHAAAEALPTDIQSIREAREELKKQLIESKNESSKIKSEIKKEREHAVELKAKISIEHDESEELSKKIKDLHLEAEKTISKCNQALSIATTEGLAAGFESQAKSLKNSIVWWVFGLLGALSFGAIMGASRISNISEALNQGITTGQAILHSIILILSIAAPLWFAWISTKQINQRFKLSEDYAYKATVSKSFIGFKQLAKELDDHETELRLFNSTMDRFDEMPLRLIEGRDYNSPWHELVDSDTIKDAIKLMPELADKLGRFANKTKIGKFTPPNRKSSREFSKVEKSEDSSPTTPPENEAA